MKNCTDCRYALWDRTKTGRLSPTGDGKCLFKIKIPVLPNAYYFIGVPNYAGGGINRKHQYDTDCPYYQERNEKDVRD